MLRPRERVFFSRQRGREEQRTGVSFSFTPKKPVCVQHRQEKGAGGTGGIFGRGRTPTVDTVKVTSESRCRILFLI